MIELFEYWSFNNCSEESNDVILHNLVHMNASDLAEYQQFYVELLAIAEFENFDEEQLHLSGFTFRKIVREAVNIVVDHYYNLEDKCDEKWNYHRRELSK